MSRLPINSTCAVLQRMSGVALLACLAAVAIIVPSGCGSTVGANASATASPGRGDAVVARVDGVGVTRADVGVILAEASLEGRSLDGSQARELAVRRVLVGRAAARAGVTVDEAAVQARLTALSERSGGEAALTSALGTAGLSRDQLRAAVAARLLEGAVADAMFPRLRAGDAAARSFYRRKKDVLFTTVAQLRLGKITMPGELIAKKVAARLAAGAPFGPTAQRFSMDPETRAQGGLLGWVSVLTVPPEVQAAVAGLTAGDVSEPVRSAGRWQLFKLYARRPAEVTPFADVAGPIRRELTRRGRAAALDDWYARARKRATVEVLP
jgi:peptidyl-prolyl cis-trans isomerase C